MFVTCNDTGKIEVFAEDIDKCYSCSNMPECPLLASLQNELVLIRYSALEIQDCGLYKEGEVPTENEFYIVADFINLDEV